MFLIKFLTTTKKVDKIEFPPDATIKQMKEKYAKDILGCDDIKFIKFIYNRSIPKDDDTVQSLGLSNNSQIIVHTANQSTQNKNITGSKPPKPSIPEITPLIDIKNLKILTIPPMYAVIYREMMLINKNVIENLVQNEEKYNPEIRQCPEAIIHHLDLRMDDFDLDGVKKGKLKKLSDDEYKALNREARKRLPKDQFMSILSNLKS